MENNTVRESKEDKETIKCLNCDSVYNNIKKLNRHRALFHEEHKPYKCANCGMYFEKEEDVLSHIDQCSKALPFKCAHCVASFDTQSELEKHSTVVHPFQCSACSWTFSLKASLLKHIKLRHSSKPEPTTVRGRVQCPLCPSTFESKSKLQRHHNGVHLKLRPYKCTQCSVTFTQRATLNKHNRDRHRTYTTSKKSRKHSNRKAVRPTYKNPISHASKKLTLEKEKLPLNDFSLAQEAHSDRVALSTSTENEKANENYHRDDKTLQIQKTINKNESNTKTAEVGNPNGLQRALKDLPLNQCSLCKKCFSQKSSLNRHLRDVHSLDTRHNDKKISEETSMSTDKSIITVEHTLSDTGLGKCTYSELDYIENSSAQQHESHQHSSSTTTDINTNEEVNKSLLESLKQKQLPVNKVDESKNQDSQRVYSDSFIVNGSGNQHSQYEYNELHSFNESKSQHSKNGYKSSQLMSDSENNKCDAKTTANNYNVGHNAEPVQNFVSYRLSDRQASVKTDRVNEWAGNVNNKSTRSEKRAELPLDIATDSDIQMRYDSVDTANKAEPSITTASVSANSSCSFDHRLPKKNVFQIKSDEEDEGDDLKQRINELYLRLEESTQVCGENKNNIDINLSTVSDQEVNYGDSSKYLGEISSDKLQKKVETTLQSGKSSESYVIARSDINVLKAGGNTTKRTSKRLSSVNSQLMAGSSNKKINVLASKPSEQKNDDEFLSLDKRTDEERQFLYLQNKKGTNSNSIKNLESAIKKQNASGPQLRSRSSKRKVIDYDSSITSPANKRSRQSDFVEGTYRCMECHAMFYKRKEYESHMEHTHRDARPYQCSKCCSCFKNEKALEIHDASVHEKLKPHVCPKCGTAFGQRASLYRHMKEVTHELIYCPDCNACFNVKRDLADHINTVHSALKPYRCDQCSRSFVSKHQLSIHIVTVHEKLRPFRCQQCGASFGQRGSLHRHMKTVDHKTVPFRCSFCSGTFRRKDDLKTHVKNEHKKIKTFSRKSGSKCVSDSGDMLDSHIEPYYSESVNQTLTASENGTSNIETGKNPPSNNSIQESNNDLQCIKCKSSFNYKKHLKRHLEYATLHAESLFCKVCKVQFCQKRQLGSHIRDLHKETLLRSESEALFPIKKEIVEESREPVVPCSSSIVENLDYTSALGVKQNLEHMVNTIKTHDSEDSTATMADLQHNDDYACLSATENSVNLYKVSGDSENCLNGAEENAVPLEEENHIVSNKEMIVTENMQRKISSNHSADGLWHKISNEQNDPAHYNGTSSPADSEQPMILSCKGCVENPTADTESVDNHFELELPTEQVVYINKERRPVKYFRDYYEDDPKETYKHSPEYILPSHSSYYSSNQHTHLNNAETASTQFAETAFDTDVGPKPIDASCKNYEQVTYNCAQTSNSLYYAQAKPRTTFLTYKNLPENYESSPVESVNAIKGHIHPRECRTIISPVKYVRTDHTETSVSDTVDALQVPVDCRSIPVTDYVLALSKECHSAVRYVEAPRLQNHVHSACKTYSGVENPRIADHIEQQLGYVESLPKPVDSPCKNYISSDYTDGSKISSLVKYAEASQKAFDSKSSSLIYPGKFTEDVKSSVYTTYKNYLNTQHVESTGHLQHGHSSDSVRFIPTLQRPVDDESSRSSVSSEFPVVANHPVKFMEALYPATEEIAETYTDIRGENPEGNIHHSNLSVKYVDQIHKHVDVDCKEYRSEQYIESIHHIPVNETVKYIDAETKPVDASKNAVYERSEYFGPITIGQVQYLAKPLDTSLQSYSGENITYAVPVNMEEIKELGNSASGASKTGQLETFYAVALDDVKDIEHADRAVVGNVLSNSHYVLIENRDSGKHVDENAKSNINDSQQTSHYAITLHLMEALEKHVGASSKSGVEPTKYQLNVDDMQLKTCISEYDKNCSISDTKMAASRDAGEKEPANDPTKHSDSIRMIDTNNTSNAAENMNQLTTRRLFEGNSTVLIMQQNTERKEVESFTNDSDVLDCSGTHVILPKDVVNLADLQSEIVKLKHPTQDNLGPVALSVRDDDDAVPQVSDGGTHLHSYLYSDRFSEHLPSAYEHDHILSVHQSEHLSTVHHN